MDRTSISRDLSQGIESSERQQVNNSNKNKQQELHEELNDVCNSMKYTYYQKLSMDRDLLSYVN